MPTVCVPDLEECDLDILENKMLPDMMNYTAQNSYCFPEDSLSLKSLSPSEEDNDYAQILPSHVQASPEDNLSLVTLPRSEDYDGGDDDDDYDAAQILPSRVQASPEDNSPRSEDGDCDDDDDEDDDDTQILPSRVQAWPEDRLFLRCSPRYKDEDDDDDADCDDDDDDDVHGTAWKENDLTLESISDEETHPGSSEDNLGLVRPPPSEDDDCDDDDDDDVQILPSRVQAWPEDRLFLRCPPRYKDEDDDDDVHGTAWNENDLTLESISDEETHPGSSEDNLGLVRPPPSEDDDCDDDDDDDVQILPSRVQAWPEDRLFLRCPPRYKDEDDDDDVHGTAWNENDLTLESISDEETHPGSSEDNLGLVRPPPSEDDDCDDDDDDDVQILPSRVQAWPEDRLFLRCPPRYKDEDDDDDVHGTAWNENDLMLESISDEETHPG
ncbi:uncharacterized protein [Chlorocebus sabaeus]